MFPATTPVRILHFEDVQSDADLIKREFTKGGITFEWLWVATRAEYVQALADFKPDVVLSDHMLPDATSVDAFLLLKKSGLDIPFVLVTATVSEEFAVMMMKEGVADYILKDRLQRLPVAVSNVLSKWEIERERSGYLDEIIKNEKRYRGLIENNNDLIGLADGNFNPIYASQSYVRITGWTFSERKRAGSTAFVHEEDLEEFRRLQEIALQNPGMHVVARYRMMHKDGHYLSMEGTIINMLQDDSLNGIIFNLRDVTKEKFAEHNLKEAEVQREVITKDLIQRNKDLEQYAYIVSHNLRAPVANIMGIASLLDGGGLDEANKKEALSGIFSASKKLDEVIRDLNFILQTRQEVNDRKEMVHFQDLVDAIQTSITNLVNKSQVKIVTNFREVDSISTVKSYMYSIFYNLISNSIKYKQRDNDPVIEITSSKNEGRIRLSFKDNGIGIDLGSQGAKVFGLYRRFHPEYAEGKGMGLFMVKTHVETLGGRISIRSEVDKGTEFIIDL